MYNAIEYICECKYVYMCIQRDVIHVCMDTSIYMYIIYVYICIQRDVIHMCMDTHIYMYIMSYDIHAYV